MENMNPESLLRKAQALGEDIKEMESIDVMGAYQQAQTQIKTNRRRSMYNQLMRYAAFLTIPLLLSSLILGYLYWGATDTEEKYAEVMAATGSVIRYELPDHSVVWLNSGSTLRYPTVFKKDNRNVELKGEAYFEVAKDKDKPFIVKTKEQNIEALGTKFNVTAYAYASDSLLTTTLLEGAVRLKTENILHQTILKPNQQFIYNRNTHAGDVRNVDAKQFTSWTTGYYYFPEQSLEAILYRLSHVYGVQFTVTSETLNKRTFTGTFYRGQSIKDIMEIVNLSIPIKYRIDDRHITVSEI